MGIGIDIIEIKRISEMIDQWGDQFLKRIFTDAEITEWESKGKRTSFLAGRFAAKEAFFKVTNEKGINWKEIEILSTTTGKPVLRFKGKEEDKEVSISHTEDLAVSVVITK